MAKADFEGWVTKNNVTCGDGLVIKENAFAHNDRQTVPLVYNHNHDSIDNVLGYCELENRREGVWGRAYLNDTESGEIAKKIVKHGDVKAFSIYANSLKKDGNKLLHGDIKEVSLVLAGCNPGAHIKYVDMAHGENGEHEEAIFSFIDPEDNGNDETIEHSAEQPENEAISHSDDKKEEPAVADETKETKTEGTSIKELFNGAMEKLSEEEQNAIYAIVGMAIGDDESKTEGEDENMKHNVFDNDEKEEKGTYISHEAMGVIIGDAKRYGSMKESVIQHSEEYGIDGIEWLFPEVHNMNTTPEFIKRDTTWVDDVFNGAHKVPWTRIKSVFADITEDDARAKGYMKGNYKKEEVFSLLKRTTQPCTIYKKQKMDRDDVVDITDFDVISWIKTEMRMMLNEEIARAILLGDGRPASSDDKINEQCIRPIYKDEAFYSIKNLVEFANDDTAAIKTKKTIDSIIRSRKFYKGSGNPTLFTTEDFVTDCLLLEDGIGHKLYKSVAEVATALRVSKIVTVEVMEGVSRVDNGVTKDLIGIIVNMKDYSVGSDKGGSVNMFEDFDIDYNQQKYLIETRCSGSLTKPFSAIVVESTTVNG
ncbi:MAG: HK97 family phage prohead protease [Paludibacteraceae bacterium]|nr:HK97 family phage prohead protease [Paludibacteraceae bacterium]